MADGESQRLCNLMPCLSRVGWLSVGYLLLGGRGHLPGELSATMSTGYTGKGHRGMNCRRTKEECYSQGWATCVRTVEAAVSVLLIIYQTFTESCCSPGSGLLFWWTAAKNWCQKINHHEPGNNLDTLDHIQGNSNTTRDSNLSVRLCVILSGAVTGGNIKTILRALITHTFLYGFDFGGRSTN